MLSDQIYAWQWGNRLRILAKAKEKMDENKQAAKVLPPGFFLPFLEAAGNVEDQEIEELWTNLLAAAVDVPDARHPLVISTIKSLARSDVDIFLLVASEWQQQGKPFPVVLNELDPPVARLLAVGLFSKLPTRGDSPEVPLMISMFGRNFLRYVSPQGKYSVFCGSRAGSHSENETRNRR